MDHEMQFEFEMPVETDILNQLYALAEEYPDSVFYLEPKAGFGGLVGEKLKAFIAPNEKNKENVTNFIKKVYGGEVTIENNSGAVFRAPAWVLKDEAAMRNLEIMGRIYSYSIKAE